MGHRWFRTITVAAAIGGLLTTGMVVIAGAGMNTYAAADASAPARVPGIPPVALDAYARAAAAAPELAPDCTGVTWPILAGIGDVESHHAAGHDISNSGDVSPRILGPRLSGADGTKRIDDTDHGHWDNDTTLDRAVGPMQFLPGTWDGHGKPGSGDGMGRDGNGDSDKDPHNMFDAAYAAVAHLCGNEPRDLSKTPQLRDALYEYNTSHSYVKKVAGRIDYYRQYEQSIDNLPEGRGTWKGPEILRAAERWKGWPYSWGGGDKDGPTYGGCCSPSGKSGADIRGFDCSGLVIYALAQVGITGVPHRATLQWEQAESWGGTRIPANAGIDALKPGDLVFFSDDGEFFPHVGIYAGDGRMFNAAAPGTKLRYDTIRDDYHGAVRFGNPNTAKSASAKAENADAVYRGTTTASYFWDDGSGRAGDTGQPASGLPMQQGMAASPSWPLHTKGYVTYNGKTMPFFVGDRGPGEPSERGIMLDLDAKTFAALTGGKFNPNTLYIDGNSGTGHIQLDYIITQWGPGPGSRGQPQPFSTGAWNS